MGKVKQVRRRLANFFNWRVSVTLTDGRVLVGVLMAVDRHVNLVLCNTEEYRKYKVKGKPEGKELKRMLGFIVLRGTNVLYVQPEEMGKDELVETDKPRKVKATAKAPAKAAAPPGLPGLMGGLPGLPGLRPGMLPGLPGGFPGLPGMRPAGLPGLPGLPGLGALPGMAALAKPGGLPAMPGLGGMPGCGGSMPGLAAMMAKAGMPGMPGMPSPRP
ncbi:unnamed protein product [Prorocentrum cordatum]|uniref:Sm protein B n=1 Tax=Prorocentrum cordatum TaxID=2364126 RepID=A0ABN9PU42_9DINO|nr:unnamed protein product [Polarella glacialis]|mmetsp:Transcript_14703/g.38882  ORF Transcript_14703/g.38882 Transcript_14703/m.38882 type:complete len:216 (+) Transcript_14703:75-722(+)